MGIRKRTQRLINFRMDQVYRGIEGTETQVITGFGETDCGIGFKLGERYLVYAYREKETYSIPIPVPGPVRYPKPKTIWQHPRDLNGLSRLHHIW